MTPVLWAEREVEGCLSGFDLVAGGSGWGEEIDFGLGESE